MANDREYTQEEVDAYTVEQFIVFGLDDEAALVGKGVRNMALPEQVVPIEAWERLEDHITSAETFHDVVIEQEGIPSICEVTAVIYRAPIVEAVRMQAKGWPVHLQAALDGLLLGYDAREVQKHVEKMLRAAKREAK